MRGVLDALLSRGMTVFEALMSRRVLRGAVRAGSRHDFGFPGGPCHASPTASFCRIPTTPHTMAVRVTPRVFAEGDARSTGTVSPNAAGRPAATCSLGGNSGAACRATSAPLKSDTDIAIETAQASASQLASRCWLKRCVATINDHCLIELQDATGGSAGSFVATVLLSRGEPRIHIDAAHPDGEAKFSLLPKVSFRKAAGPPHSRCPKQLSKTTSRRSRMPGSTISAPELTHVSRHGFWLRMADEEVLLSFAEFPWFRHATIEQLSIIERPTAEHLYWPLFDVNLSVASVRDPFAFPLVFSVTG